MAQSLDRARQKASLGEPSPPVTIRIWASAEWAAGCGSGFFLVVKQGKEPGLGIEDELPGG